MKDALRIAFKRAEAGGGTWRQFPHEVSLDRLDVVMACANRHFSTNPERQLGGPRLSPKDAK